MKEGRRGCINPRCGRTFKDDGHPRCCGRCWKLIPVALKRRYRALLKRSRKMERMIKKAPHIKRRGERYGAPDRGEPQDYILRAQIWRLWLANWGAIERYFREPDAPPEGIESFLKEMGMST